MKFRVFDVGRDHTGEHVLERLTFSGLYELRAHVGWQLSVTAALRLDAWAKTARPGDVFTADGPNDGFDVVVLPEDHTVTCANEGVRT